MKDIPAGWYDDPEDPMGYRYWDGAEWTAHRSPKRVLRTAAATPSSELSAVLGETGDLLTATWRRLAVLGAIIVVVGVACFAIVAVAANDALEPGFFDIVTRVTEPGFNPELDDGDQIFLDSITFDPDVMFWTAAIGAGVVATITNLLGLAVATVLLASSRAGRQQPLGRCLRLALARLPRWIGIMLLWALSYAVIIGIVVGLVALGVAVFWPLAVLIVLGAIAALIWIYPVVWLMFTALFAGPRDEPPFRSAYRLVEGRWKTVALPVLIINLINGAGGAVFSAIGVIPVVGFFVSALGTILMYGVVIAATIVLWTRLGGALDPEYGDADVS